MRKEEPLGKLPPLAESFAEILENQRAILMSRKKICELRKQQFNIWVERCRAEGVEDLGEMIRKNVVEYFEQELVAITYLVTTLNEKQREGSVAVAQMELELENRKEAARG